MGVDSAPPPVGIGLTYQAFTLFFDCAINCEVTFIINEVLFLEAM